MKSPAYEIIRKFNKLMQIGVVNYLRYRLTAKGDTLKIHLKGKDILIRGGSPDLSTAHYHFIGEFFNTLSNYLPHDYKGIIVDAGGYIGTSVLALRDLFPHARIITIEPSQDNIQILRRNVAHLDNVEIIHAALVGKKRKSVILWDRGKKEWGFTTVAQSANDEASHELHETPALTLGELGVNPAEIGILKLNIEGGEAEILRHDAKTLKSIKVVVAYLHDDVDPDCSRLFAEFSQDRKLVNVSVDKYLSVMEG